MNGVTFGYKHSYLDFGLILVHKKNGYPNPKTNYLSIEGANGDIDLSTALTNEIVYEDRELSFEFSIFGQDFEAARTKLGNYLHGKEMKIVMDDDPEYYYYGRCTINEFETDGFVGSIVIDVKAKPFKYKQVNDAVTFTGNGTKTMKADYKDIRNFGYTGNGQPMSVNVNGETFQVSSSRAFNRVNVPLKHQGYNSITCTSESAEEQTFNFVYEVGEL